jgi:DNA-binding transcriptional ArsR family regulator
MKSEKPFEEMLKSLKSIEEKLEILINLQKVAMPKPKVTTEEKKILKLCDKKHTAEEIAKETGKTENNVNVTLSRLRDKGLIKSAEVKDRTVYEKI